jgi:hypothetical protein
MQIEIPKDAEVLVKGQADAAGFTNVEDYIANLIRNHTPAVKLTREQALSKLRKLRSKTPKMTQQEIVDMVAEARADLP